jgi:probable rRNA maturation factor
MIRRRGRPQGAPVVDIVVEAALWKDRRGVKPLLRRALAEAAAMLSTTDAELAIVLTDDSAIRRLNRRWRGKDEPTNVLAFPAKQPRTSSSPHRLIGDIVIAYQTLAREAAAAHKPFRHHLAHLAVHGYLHLSGHDHGTDGEAAVMEGLEIAILARLGIPNPYVAHGRNG